MFTFWKPFIFQVLVSRISWIIEIISGKNLNIFKCRWIAIFITSNLYPINFNSEVNLAYYFRQILFGIVKNKLPFRQACLAQSQSCATCLVAHCHKSYDFHLH